MPCYVHCLLHDQPVVPFMKHYNVHIFMYVYFCQIIPKPKKRGAETLHLKNHIQFNFRTKEVHTEATLPHFKTVHAVMTQVT